MFHKLRQERWRNELVEKRSWLRFLAGLHHHEPGLLEMQGDDGAADTIGSRLSARTGHFHFNHGSGNETQIKQPPALGPSAMPRQSNHGGAFPLLKVGERFRGFSGLCFREGQHFDLLRQDGSHFKLLRTGPEANALHALSQNLHPHTRPQIQSHELRVQAGRFVFEMHDAHPLTSTQRVERSPGIRRELTSRCRNGITVRIVSRMA